MSGRELGNRDASPAPSSNPFQYQEDTINQYQQQTLPKVRNANTAQRPSPQNAAPATPRMIRNASNNVLNPSNNNLNDYHINTNFQFQQNQQNSTSSSTPKRTLSSPNPRAQNQAPSNQVRQNAQFLPTKNSEQLHSPNVSQNYQAPASSRQPQQQYNNTPTKTILLPPANVEANSARAEQDGIHPRRSSQSHHAKTSSQKQAAQHTQEQQAAQSSARADGQFHRKSIGEWDFYKTIGAGSMGKVKLAKHRRTGEVCAVKVVPRAEKIWLRQNGNAPPTTDANELAKRLKEYEKEVARDKRTIREAALDKIMYHPYICRLYELIPMTNHYYMLFEYVSGGQMLDYIVSHGSLKERHARKFARGIASALDYCHSNNIVHRDLKIENIMISKSGEIKIIDFGLSNMYDRKSQLKTFCGSLYFAAPELLSAQPYLGPEVDIWSFGVVLYVLVCGKVPFDDPSVSALHSKIKQGNVTYPDHLSWSCISLLQRMLVVNPAKRAPLKEIINHTWMIDESEKPAYNYLPYRVPLSLPLDPEVIKEIASLQLATEDTVINDLTDVLTSAEYSEAVAHWYAQKEGNSRHSRRSDVLDPTNAYHPLVSIYYLVDEMQKRKKAKELNNKSQLQQAQDLRQKQILEQQHIAHQEASKSGVGRTPVVAQDQFAPVTPQKREETDALQPKAPVISFPEAAYTASHGQQNFPERTSSVEETSVAIPNQQASRSQSPKGGMTPIIDQTLNSVKSNEDDNGKSGINFLLRRLSGKRPKQHYKQQPSSNNEFERIIQQYDQQPSHGAEPHGQQATSGSDIEKLHPAPAIITPSPTDSSSKLEAYAPQPFQGRVDPLVRRVGSMKITSKEKEAIQAQAKHAFPPLPNKYEQQIQQHQRTVSTSASARKAAPSISIVEAETPSKPLSTSTAGHKMHPSARAKSVGHVRNNSLYNKNGAPTAPVPTLPQEYADDDYFDDVNLNDESFRKQDNVSTTAGADMTEQQLIYNFETAPSGTMPSIEYPKTLFLKGFFSVQTTSTKPLPVIRNNIIVVLSKLGVQFKEVKGGFICSHSPSITTAIATAPPDGNIEIDAGDHLDTLEDKEYNEKDTRGSNSSNSFKESVDNNEQASGSSLTSSPSNSASKGHRRKFSLGNGLLRKKPDQPGRLNTNFSTTPNVFDNSSMPLTPAPANVHRHRHSHSINSNESQDSVDSIHEFKGASDMLLSSRVDQMKSPTLTQRESFSNERSGKGRSPLKFEIHVVKVPLVGLFGVQFKKLTGNTWMYKTLAGEILRELNL